MVGGKARAYPFERLAGTPLVQEGDVTVWFDPASRSAAAFDRSLDGKRATFERVAGVIRDSETKSTWTMDGRCVDGSRKGAQLTPLHGLMSEWYGWSASYPETSVWAP